MWDELAAQASGGVCCAVCGRACISEASVGRVRLVRSSSKVRMQKLMPKSQSLGRASCQLYRYTTPSNSTPSTTSRAAHPERRLIAHRLANPNLAAKATKAVSDAVERLKQPRELLSRAAHAAVELVGSIIERAQRRSVTVAAV